MTDVLTRINLTEHSIFNWFAYMWCWWLFWMFLVWFL